MKISQVVHIELQQSDVNKYVAHFFFDATQLSLLGQLLRRLKSSCEVGNDLILQEALLHFVHLVRLLPRLELLDNANIGKGDEFATFSVEIDSCSVDFESSVPI